ncbi:FAD-binding oxidoreductase [soil metagenome]
MTSNGTTDFRDGLLRPGEPGFEDASRLWNARIGRRPDLVARCSDARQVGEAVEHARRNGLRLSVKGGGHSYAANTVADGGLLIDLSPMKGVLVDAQKRTATVEGGVTCGELDAATQLHGLAAPTPTVSSVGVVGAALGGGGGYLTRKYGLTLDNAISMHVVTADGRKVTASESENADLFWALRGGGGNFGIVTQLELRLHPVGPEVLAGQVIYPFDDVPSLIRYFREFMAQAPDEFQCYPFMFRVPAIDVFPAETHGQPVIDFVFCHADPDSTDFVQPLRKLGRPILDAVAPTPYVSVQQTFDANLPAGQRYYSKAHDLAALSDEVIATVVDFVPRMKGPLTAAYFDPGGGAAERVDIDATAYFGRRAPLGFHILSGWMEAAEDEAVMSWTSDFHAALAPAATGGVYVNLLADDERERVPAAYGDNYGRLRELKRAWDPANVFRGNHNIPPAD